MGLGDPYMQVWDIGDISIVLCVFKLAKSVGFKLTVKRGSMGYNLAVRIAVTAFVVLYRQSNVKALKLFEKTVLHRKMGLKTGPSPASVMKWKSTYEVIVRALIRRSFLMLARGRANKLLGVIDGSRFKLSKASEHYLKRIGKKAFFLLIAVLYAPEIDAVYNLVAAPNCNSENKAFWNYQLSTIIYSGIFWGIVGDKKYDDSAITEWLEAHCILTFIQSSKGQIEPTSGSRYRANKRYELLMSIKNDKVLVESVMFSIKPFTNEVKSKLTRPNEYDALIMALAYNVARLIKKGEITA